MASIHKRGKSWVLYWREDKRPRSKSLGTIAKKDALLAKAEKEYHLNNNTQFKVIPFNLFTIDYLKWFEVEFPDSYERSNQIVRDYLIPFFGNSAISTISIKQVDKYKVTRLASAKSATVIKELNVLNAILNKAVNWKDIPENPIKGFSRPQDTDSKPPQFFTSEELKTIYKKSPSHAHWWKLIVNTGMRRKEARQLKWEHIEPGHINVLSTSNARTKSGKWRKIPLNKEAKAALKKFPKDSEYVFPQINPRSISRAFEKDLGRAKVPGSIHVLRHTFCSHLVMNGVPLRTVQVLAGHANMTTTEKYAHLAPDHLKNATKVLNL